MNNNLAIKIELENLVQSLARKNELQKNGMSNHSQHNDLIKKMFLTKLTSLGDQNNNPAGEHTEQQEPGNEDMAENPQNEQASSELNTWRDVIMAQLSGETIEFRFDANSKWAVMNLTPRVDVDKLDKNFIGLKGNFRIKRKTIKIGEVEVPEPLSVNSQLEEGQEVYTPAHWRNDLSEAFKWDSSVVRYARLLKAGRLHATREGAQIHAKAEVELLGRTNHLID